MNRAKNQTATSTDDLQDDAPGFTVHHRRRSTDQPKAHSIHDSIELAAAAVAAFWKNTEPSEHPGIMTITDPTGVEVLRQERPPTSSP